MAVLWSEKNHILQIGIDTGDLARRLLEDRVSSQLTVMDDSDDILRHLRSYLKPFGVRLKTLRGRPEIHFDFQAYDAVLSHLILHEIERDVDKTAVCRNVFASLRPGGLFAFTVVHPYSRIWISKKIRRVCARQT